MTFTKAWCKRCQSETDWQTWHGQSGSTYRCLQCGTRNLSCDREVSEDTDWQGNKVPPHEPDDKEILVWEIEPHFDSSCTTYVERSWQRMLEYVECGIESWLESPEELVDHPVKFAFRLRKMSVAEWRAFGGEE